MDRRTFTARLRTTRDRRKRLEEEAAKLDPEEERALAEEGMAGVFRATRRVTDSGSPASRRTRG